MKKTKVLTTIAFISFIFALCMELFYQLEYFFRYVNNHDNLNPKLVYIACFIAPLVAGSILLIIGVNMYSNDKNHKILPIGFFVVSLGFIYPLIADFRKIFVPDSYGSTSRFFISKYLIFLILTVLIGIGFIVKPKKLMVMCIIASAVLVAFTSLIVYYELSESLKSLDSMYYQQPGMPNQFERIILYIGYYAALQFIGLGGLLFAISNMKNKFEKKQKTEF